MEYKICLASLTAHTNGIIDGEWIDLTDANAMDKIKAFKDAREGHEFFIGDTSMACNLGINEFDNIDFLLEMSENYFSNWSEEQIEVFSELITELDWDWTCVANKVNNYDYALIEIGACKSDEEAVGRYYAEYLDIPNHIKPFFDYERYGRNILEENDNITADDYVIIVY